MLITVIHQFAQRRGMHDDLMNPLGEPDQLRSYGGRRFAASGHRWFEGYEDVRID